VKPRLSPRERDVFLLIAKGLNNKQIARELGLSVHTTKHHVSRLFDRIDVVSRLQAAIWYTQEGVKQ
jgi:DNA-binding NarL/FixJ family response regulator